MTFKTLFKFFVLTVLLSFVSCNFFNPSFISQKDLTDEEKKSLMLDRYSPTAMGGSLIEDSATVMTGDLSFIIKQLEENGIEDVSAITKENIVKIEKPFESEVLVTDLILNEETITLVYCYFSTGYALATFFSPNAFETIISSETMSKESQGAWLLNAYVTSGIANPVYQFKTIEKYGDKYRTKMTFKPTSE